MIDVPVAVKDALREGTYKKNYRLVVQREVTTRVVVPVATLTASAQTFTVTEANDYILYNESTAHAFDYVDVTGDSWTYELPCPEGGTETWFELRGLGSGVTITVNTLNAESLYITTADRVTYSTSYEDDPEIGTIDNDYLVSETVNIDERMCSGDKLKFGLCEGASIEFQYFNKPNITGRRIQAFVDIPYDHEWSDEAVRGITQTIAGDSNISFWFTYDPGGGGILPSAEVKITSIEGYVSRFTFTPAVTSLAVNKDDVIEITRVQADIPPIITAYIKDTFNIPMGFFDIKKCSRQASTGIIKATGYNKLQSEYLDAKAAEQIDALLEAGEDGMNDVSLYDILRQLLEGYSINKYDQSVTVSRTSVTEHDENYFLINYNRKDFPSQSHTGRLKIKYDNITFTIPSSFVSPGMYYNAKIKYRLAEAIQSAFYRMISGIDESDYDFYTTVNYLDASSRTIDSVTYTLQDIFNNAVKAAENTNIKSDLYTMKGGARFRVLNSGPVLETYNDLNELRRDLITRAHCYDNTRVSLAFPTKIYIVDNIVDELANTLVSVDISITPADVIDLNILELSDLQKMRFSVEQEDLFSDVTLRELQTAVFETQCQFGQLDRVTDLFSGVELNHSRLYPADSLYPATNLYPDGAAVSGFKSMYSKLWADEGNIHRWRNLVITYKGLNADQQEEDFTLERQVNADGTDDYNMSDNWLFRNLIWTAEQIAEYAAAMVAKMQDMTWFPFEMWCAGLPYLETGDEIEIPLGDQSYTSYVLQRQLKGIQNLQDTYINGTLDIF